MVVILEKFQTGEYIGVKYEKNRDEINLFMNPLWCWNFYWMKRPETKKKTWLEWIDRNLKQATKTSENYKTKFDFECYCFFFENNRFNMQQQIKYVRKQQIKYVRWTHYSHSHFQNCITNETLRHNPG